MVKFRMFNFGNPAARQYMIDTISDLIDKEGIDVYRQDCNFALAPFWAEADTPDREGMTQIRYAEGLLAFWDGLRQRIPISSWILCSAAIWKPSRAPST